MSFPSQWHYFPMIQLKSSRVQTRAWYPIVSRPLSAIDMTMIVLAKYPLLRGGHSHRQPTFIVSPPLQLSFTCNRWCPLTLDSHHSHKKQRKREISGLRQIQASGGSIRYQYYWGECRSREQRVTFKSNIYIFNDQWVHLKSPIHLQRSMS